MRVVAALGVLLLAGSSAIAAEDAKAPLSDAKQQLQQLERDQRAAKADSPDAGLKGAMPTMTLGSAASDAVTPADPNQKQKEKGRGQKHDQQKNWLVDGYEKLDPKAEEAKAKDKEAGVLEANSDEKENEEDSGDRENLLTLYQKQEKADHAASDRQKTSVETATHVPSADPMAPFLKDWLANSPVRDAALSTVSRTDNSAGSSDGATAPSPVDGPSGTASNSAALSLLSGNPQAKADNPYLSGLVLPALSASSTTPAFGLPSPVTDSLSTGTAPKIQPIGPLDPLVVPAKNEFRKPPATPADEDKKYFPQLKRF